MRDWDVARPRTRRRGLAIPPPAAHHDTIAATEPRAGRVATVVAGLGLAAMLLYRMGPCVVDPDLWHEMALAREAVARGAVPWRDHFAYTRTLNPVVHHEWGAGMIAYALAMGPGAPGIVLARYALVAALAAIALGIARRRGAGWPVLTFLAPLALLLLDEWFSTIRAQMYSFVAFALLLRLLDARRNGWRWWAGLAAMTLAWVNVHGGFLAGAGVLGAHWVERVWRRERHAPLLAAGLAMAAMVAANPYGLHYYAYLARAATMARPHVDEWLPLWRAPDPTKRVVFAASLAIAAYAVAGVGIRRAHGVLALALTALAGAQRSRLVAFYAIAWLAYVPAWVEATPLGTSIAALSAKRGRFLAVLWGSAALILLARALPLRPWSLRVPSRPIPGAGRQIDYPVGAVDYLARNRFRGNVMVPFDWGAYVSWKLHPAVKVGMDGRYEVAYPEAVVDDNYRLFMGEPGWERILAADPTDVVLIPDRLPLAGLMPQVPGWRRVYADGTFTLYARPGLGLPAADRPDRNPVGTFP